MFEIYIKQLNFLIQINTADYVLKQYFVSTIEFRVKYLKVII